MNQQEIQAIVEKQRAFFHTGATLDVEKRIQALKKLQSCILRYEDEIGAALTQDLGKSSFESYMCESGLVLSELSYMLRHVRSYSREKRVRTPLAQFHSRSFKKPSPLSLPSDHRSPGRRHCRREYRRGKTQRLFSRHQ